MYISPSNKPRSRSLASSMLLTSDKRLLLTLIAAACFTGFMILAYLMLNGVENKWKKDKNPLPVKDKYAGTHDYEWENDDHVRQDMANRVNKERMRQDWQEDDKLPKFQKKVGAGKKSNGSNNQELSSVGEDDQLDEDISLTESETRTSSDTSEADPIAQPSGDLDQTTEDQQYNAAETTTAQQQQLDAVTDDDANDQQAKASDANADERKGQQSANTTEATDDKSNYQEAAAGTADETKDQQFANTTEATDDKNDQRSNATDDRRDLQSAATPAETAHHHSRNANFPKNQQSRSTHDTKADVNDKKTSYSHDASVEQSKASGDMDWQSEKTNATENQQSIDRNANNGTNNQLSSSDTSDADVAVNDKKLSYENATSRSTKLKASDDVDRQPKTTADATNDQQPSATDDTNDQNSKTTDATNDQQSVNADDTNDKNDQDSGITDATQGLLLNRTEDKIHTKRQESTTDAGNSADQESEYPDVTNDQQSKVIDRTQDSTDDKAMHKGTKPLSSKWLPSQVSSRNATVLALRNATHDNNSISFQDGKDNVQQGTVDYSTASGAAIVKAGVEKYTVLEDSSKVTQASNIANRSRNSTMDLKLSVDKIGSTIVAAANKKTPIGSKNLTSVSSSITANQEKTNSSEKSKPKLTDKEEHVEANGTKSEDNVSASGTKVTQGILAVTSGVNNTASGTARSDVTSQMGAPEEKMSSKTDHTAAEKDEYKQSAAGTKPTSRQTSSVSRKKNFKLDSGIQEADVTNDDAQGGQQDGPLHSTLDEGDAVEPDTEPQQEQTEANPASLDEDITSGLKQKKQQSSNSISPKTRQTLLSKSKQEAQTQQDAKAEDL